MGNHFTVLQAHVTIDYEGDPDELAGDYLELRDELLELDNVSVEPTRAQAPPDGAKSGLADVSNLPLILAIFNSAGIVALAGVLRSWVGRDRRRKLTVRIGEDLIEVSNASKEDQSRAIDVWLSRHVQQ